LLAALLRKLHFSVMFSAYFTNRESILVLKIVDRAMLVDRDGGPKVTVQQHDPSPLIAKASPFHPVTKNRCHGRQASGGIGIDNQYDSLRTGYSAGWQAGSMTRM
jgi:hypothetical protein